MVLSHTHPNGQQRHFNGFSKEFMFSLQQFEMMVLSAPFVLVDHFISFFLQFSLVMHLILGFYVSVHGAFIGIVSQINRGNVFRTVVWYTTHFKSQEKEKIQKKRYGHSIYQR